MKKKYKLKKSAIKFLALFFLLLIVLLVSIFSLFESKSYSVEYNIDTYEISENYDNKEKFFYYEITSNELTYNFIFYSDYQKEKKLIKDIKEYKDNNYTCLTIKSSFINSYPLCSYKNTLIDYHLVSDKLKEKLSDYYKNIKIENKKYNNYQLYNLDNKILVWSYKGFNYLNKNDFEFIKIFNKDVYEIPLATKLNNYLFIPDYEQEHNFDKVYILNLENMKLEEWKLKYKISFDSYILGTNDKSIYLIDNKNKIEYELVPHKQKMRIIATKNKDGLIYEKNQTKKISMNKLTSTIYSFTYKNNYNYFIENNKLYLTYLNEPTKTKISNNDIDSIVHIKNDEIYYLVDETLYKYSLKFGEIKIMSYSEWEFNNKNLIFIYD